MRIRTLGDVAYAVSSVASAEARAVLAVEITASVARLRWRRGPAACSDAGRQQLAMAMKHNVDARWRSPPGARVYCQGARDVGVLSEMRRFRWPGSVAVTIDATGGADHHWRSGD